MTLLLSASGVLLALAFFAWQYFFPVQANDGWSYRVAYPDVDRPSGLVPLADGSLWIGQELQGGKGSILRIDEDGHRQLEVENLSKPSGMIYTRGGLVFSQEVGGAPVSFVRDGQTTGLFSGENVQGLWDDGDSLYAIEDRRSDGRLLRYRWSDQSLTVLRDRLSEAESITRCLDGQMLYTKKGSGAVHRLTADGDDPAIFSGLNKPSFLMCDKRGLWISEDSTHRARLLLIDPEGHQSTILSFLKAPQSIVPTGKGTYLISEGGRDRVLELMPQGG
ncbi:hypothetical protein HW090_17195 [Pseudomonas sp. ABC1]|nr:hypothetical protein [Pseudomonas sp. ABC1]QLF95115.1 hypothetical protein HW090_17195 [Pseudomonas sp. ABC1]